MVAKEETIKGFVKNEGVRAYFKLQRPLPPDGKITFNAAFLVVGKKSGKKGKEFVEWLRENIFLGPAWGFYVEEGVPFFSSSTPDPAPVPISVDSAEARGAGRVMKREQKNKHRKGTEVTAASIVEAEFSKAKDMIDSCRDKALLRKALNLSQYLAGKSEHMRHLIRRLEQV